jgi:hypothetical protein
MTDDVQYRAALLPRCTPPTGVLDQRWLRDHPWVRVDDMAGAAARGIAEDRLRLHRVLTGAVEPACPGGGAFAYTVDIGFTENGA